MARKTWLFIRAGVFISFLLVLWNFFWMLKLQQPQQLVPSKIHSIFTSPVPQLTKSEKLNTSKRHFSANVQNEKPQEIRIAAVVCGNRTNETLVMMKSALIMSRTFTRFILFADENATSALNATVKFWPEDVLNRMSLDLRPITFPPEKAEEWKKLFKPCASQRLFLPVSFALLKFFTEIQHLAIFINLFPFYRVYWKMWIQYCMWIQTHFFSPPLFRFGNTSAK